MIPLRDSVRPRRFPIVNVSIIVVNILVFVYELALGPRAQDFIQTYGVIPERLMSPGNFGFLPFLTLITSMFLHGGLLHIVGNMLYLWVFGDNVEDQMGRAGYLVFYLISGITAGLTHVVFNAGSVVPTIGASGAVAGVLGAYFVSFPRAKVLALFPISFLLPIVEVRAVYYLAFWFIFQVFSGLAAIRAGAMAQPIAWWAHIGGFIIGAILIRFFRNRTYVMR